MPLVNNEVAFGQWLSRVKPGEKTEQRYGEIVVKVREMPCSCGKRQMPPEPYYQRRASW